VRPLACLLFAALVSGCAFTRISPEAHQTEVSGLGLVGLAEDDALARVRAAGFRCDSTLNSTSRDTQWSTRSPGSPGHVTARGLTCTKKSAELMCPQTRFLRFETEVDSGRVIEVTSRTVEQSCF
jgi:hypothetical protein